ncbi:DUF2971 domain-containing protein [Collimonas sp. H4R21]|uniref:DUF2971 domain-containing protein n=1 Tax=Collimonas rhizosphaerae TaxID=3126357 RepID=A0ABU9Q174_9BURK
MNPPASLYKYEAFSTQSLLNLKGQIIYFGSPLKFNDPYDCALTPNILIPTDFEIETIRQAYLKMPNIPARSRQDLEVFDPPRMRESLMRAARTGFSEMVDKFLAQRGVACFSETNDDLLMWSHYGGHYKGFCLEFNTSTEPFKKINQVKYVSMLPGISISNALLDSDFHPVQELFCTKSKAWEYEKEWRAIHGVAGTQFRYSPETLTGVYFGPDIDEQSLEILCLILAGQNESVQLWRGKRSTTEFRVLFEPFTYMSYLDAKRRGLR